MPTLLKRCLLLAPLTAILAGAPIACAEGAQRTGGGERPVLLGREAVARASARLAPGRARAFAVRSQRSGVGDAVRIYLGRSTARWLAVGIYANHHGAPGALLGVGTETGPRNGWSTVSLAPVHLRSGALYWLGLLARGGSARYRAAFGACATAAAGPHRRRQLPARWSGSRATGGRCAISAYVLGPPQPGGAMIGASAPQGIAPIESTLNPHEEASGGALPSTNCFEDPEREGSSRLEACGYPGPKNTAVQNCAELPSTSGAKTITTDGAKVENTDITGQVIVEASGVTLNHDCVIVNGQQVESAIHLEGSATRFQVSNTTIRAEDSGSAAFEEGVSNNDPSAGTAIVSNDVIEDCGECLHGSIEASDSYVLANARLGDGGLHRETWYANNGTIIARHDTFLVPEDQTAIIFDNVANGVEHTEECSNHVTVEESLMAGAGQMIQTCGPRATGPGSATLTVRENRFARCLSKPVIDKRCSGSGFEGSDAHGYFPAGGWISLLGDPPYGTLRWEGNYWDDNLRPASH